MMSAIFKALRWPFKLSTAASVSRASAKKTRPISSVVINETETLIAVYAFSNVRLILERTYQELKDAG